jgi:hypothetical protein
VAENDFDGIGRPLSVASQQANAAEILAELVRLVESSGGLAHERSAAPAETVSELPAETVSEPNRTDPGSRQPLETTSLHPSIEVEALSNNPSVTGAIYGSPRILEFDNSRSNYPNGIGLATGGGAGVWALALVGAAAIGSIFWLEGVDPGPPKAPPFIGAAQGPATAPPSANLTIATSSDAPSTLSRDVSQPVDGKVVSAEEQPIDLHPPLSADMGKAAMSAAKPAPDAAGKPLAAAVNTTAAAEPITTSPSAAAQSPDLKPAPTVSPPSDATQIATPTPPAPNSGVTAPASDAPLPPVRHAPKVATEATGVAPRSTPKPDLPTKLSGKSAAHVVLAKAEASDPLPPAETPRGAVVNPEKKAKTLKAMQAPAGAQPVTSQPVTPEQPAPAAQQPSSNPVAHAFGNVVGMMGALTGLIPFLGH